MNNLTVFNYEQNEIRTVTIDGEPWWVLADVCRPLNLTNPRKIAVRLDQDEKGVTLIYTLGGPQEMAIIVVNLNTLTQSEGIAVKETKI